MALSARGGRTPGIGGIGMALGGEGNGNMTSETLDSNVREFHHFLEVADYDGESLAWLLKLAAEQKIRFARGELEPVLRNKALAMIFEKPSLRTRLSFEVAMTHLGGHAVNLTRAEIGLGTREAVKDIARVVADMADGIVIRTFAHEHLREIARFSSVPVINALSDYCHPCQAMADLMTVAERFGTLGGRKLAFIGDGNNVARSLASSCVLLGVGFAICSPDGYELEGEFLSRTERLAPGAVLERASTPADAVRDADVIYTDTWVSMGQEDEQEARRAAFEAYQVNAELLACAPSHAIVMHCLPAYRESEITDEVLESPQSVVFEQAANRLHFQRCLLSVVMGNK